MSNATALVTGTDPVDAVAVLLSVDAQLDQVPLTLHADCASRVVEIAERIIRRVQSVKLAAVQAKAAVVPGPVLSSWLAKATNSDPAKAGSDAKLAGQLTSGSPTAAGLAKGDFSTDHARVITGTLIQLPPDVTAGERDRIESALARRARYLTPSKLRREARYALKHANRPAEQVAQHADATLRSEEERAREATRISFRDNGDGTTFCSATIPTFHSSLLRKLLQSMTAPRVTAMHDARERKQEGASFGTFGASVAADDAATDWPHEWGLAFCQLLEHLPTDHLSGKVAATVVVTMDLQSLRDGLAAATLDTGDDLSAAGARRLACNAGLVPAVLDGESLPLDLGRQVRFFTEGQRLALATRYVMCAEEDCTRPFAWTELHHKDLWNLGGLTDLDLAVPLCAYHHHEVHKPTNSVTYLRSGPTWVVRISPRT